MQNGQQQHNQREPKIIDQHCGKQHRTHRHFDNQDEKPVRQILRDSVDGRDTIGQIAYQPVFEKLDRQPQQPRHAAIVADHRNPDCEPLQEPVLEQRQDIYQDAAANQGCHQSAPGPVVLQDIVHKDAERRGRDKRQQCQHECAGDHPGKHIPGPGEQGVQLPEKPGPFAARAEIRAALEAQRNSAVAPVELLGGKPAPARGRVIEVEIGAVGPFEDNEMAELPEQDQRQLQLLQLGGAQAEPAAFEAVVPGGAQYAGRAAAVPAHLAFFPQFRQRHPAPEIGQYAAEAGGAAFRCVHLQQNWRGYPSLQDIRCGLVASPPGGAQRHLMTALSAGTRPGTACPIR